MNRTTTGLAKKGVIKLLGLTMAIFTLAACETLPQRAGDPNQCVAIANPLAALAKKGRGSNIGSNDTQAVQYLDVAIHEFGQWVPNTNANGAQPVTPNVDPETALAISNIRKTEKVKFPYNTARAIRNTGKFGSVSVVPFGQPPAEFVIDGSIQESDGLDVSVKIRVTSAKREVLGEKVFTHNVPSEFVANTQNNATDLYDPLYQCIAIYVASLADQLDAEDKTTLRNLNRATYAQKYAPEKYANLLQTNADGTVSLNGFPSEEDTLFEDIESLRNQENVFTDQLQKSYDIFNQSTDQTYLVWQRQNHQYVKEIKAAKTGEAIATLAEVGFGIFGVVKAVEGKNKQAAGGAVGVAVADTIRRNQAAKASQMTLALNEMNNIAEDAVKETVITFDGKKKRLKGTLGEQFTQMQAYLRQMFDDEQASGKRL